MSTVTLRDLCNQDDDGAPFVMSGTLEQAIAYLDGPVRRDTRAEDVQVVDAVVAELRSGQFDSGATGATRLGVELTRTGADS